ncbi:helix-turn-helix domain-containing protein [Lysobacter sp. F6437]|uniref:helix-turn-helix domain-containing protein n=1 Tax=Lysobacter sp. F6437 TaxID=3459296 RepID=UPI00403DA6E5
MKLLKANAWADKYFGEESRPAEITVMRWLRDGKIPGRKVGGTWYVDEHAWLADGDPLVQQVLEAG